MSRDFPGTDARSWRTLQREIAARPRATHEDNLELIRRSQDGDREALDELVTRNLRLVTKIAWQFRGCGREIGDLVQDGTLGLLRAVARFDPSQGCTFATYAGRLVHQAMIQSLEDRGSLIRVPARQQRRGLRAPTTYSLDEPSGREGARRNVADLLPTVEGGQEPHAEAAWAAARLDRLLDRLSEREAEIVRCRAEGHSTGELGRRLKLSRQRVSQLEQLALQKLRGEQEQGGLGTSLLTLAAVAGPRAPRPLGPPR
ncbi:MAG: sigma-70 family RNA polymerase sigma factor [Acidobacteriota bacterium]